MDIDMYERSGHTRRDHPAVNAGVTRPHTGPGHPRRDEPANHVGTTRSPTQGRPVHPRRDDPFTHAGTTRPPTPGRPGHPRLDHRANNGDHWSHTPGPPGYPRRDHPATHAGTSLSFMYSTGSSLAIHIIPENKNITLHNNSWFSVQFTQLT